MDDNEYNKTYCDPECNNLAFNENTQLFNCKKFKSELLFYDWVLKPEECAEEVGNG